MVFHSVFKAETPPPHMASTLSPKSQPLHYFPHSNLKWSMNHSDAHRLRRLPDPTNHSDDAVRSPEFPSSSGSGNSDRNDPVATYHLIEKGEKSATMKSIENFDEKMVSTVRIVEKKGEELNGSEGKPKIFIRIPVRSKAAAHVTDTVDKSECAAEDEEPLAKTWNLRPRRSVTKHLNRNGGAPKNGMAPVQEFKSQAQIRPELAAPENDRQKKQKFSPTLLKEEIEEDFLLLTGSKPPRRPKKRARNVQKQMDCLFPGLELTYVTPDLYEVPDTRHKG